MSVAWEIEIETYRPQLYVVSDQHVRTAPLPAVRRRRMAAGALVAMVVALLVLLTLPIRSLGGSTLAQAAPAHGQEYIVRAGDTPSSIARQADPAHATTLAARLAQETGSNVLVQGEHVFIP